MSKSLVPRPSEISRISYSQTFRYEKILFKDVPIFLLVFFEVLWCPRVQIWSHFSKFQKSSNKYCNRSGTINQPFGNNLNPLKKPHNYIKKPRQPCDHQDRLWDQWSVSVSVSSRGYGTTKTGYGTTETGAGMGVGMLRGTQQFS